jgi:hypothetical protein
MGDSKKQATETEHKNEWVDLEWRNKVWKLKSVEDEDWGRWILQVKCLIKSQNQKTIYVPKFNCVTTHVWSLPVGFSTSIQLGRSI